MCNTTQRPFTVLIEGNIGCGKTTFLNHFKKFEDVCVLTEPIQMWRDCRGHNLLNLMYQDTNNWSFPFQSYVILTMLQMHSLKIDKPIKLMERSMYSARYCFIEKMTKDGKMLPAASAVLDEWFTWLDSNTDIPVDLIVYLRSSPDVAYERIKTRNRSEETSIPFDYIKELHKYHEDWLYYNTSFSLPAPVLTLNADLDISTIKDEYDKFEPCILNKIVTQA